MARRPRSVTGLAALALAVVALSGSIGVYVGAGGAVGHAPSDASPPWPLLSVNPAVYDAAENYDLWLLTNGATWSYAAGHWENLTPTAGVPTSMESNVRMVYDAAAGDVVLYGGEAPRLPFPPLNDTWLFVDGRWTNVTSRVLGAPPAGSLGLMAYDSADRDVVLYGAQPYGQTTPQAVTWVYSNLNWTNESVSGPRPIVSYAPTILAGFADDPADGYVLFYSFAGGGCAAAATGCPILWTYAGGVWTNRTTTVSPLPSLILFTAFTYDSTANEVVAVGGCDNSTSYTCPASYGTFVYHAGVWTDVTPSGGISPREFASSVDDPSDGGVMVVGGCCWADFTGLSLMWQDVWVYAHGSWSERLPWGGGPPLPWQNDGFWIGVGAIGVPALLVVARRRDPGSGPPRP